MIWALLIIVTTVTGSLQGVVDYKYNDKQ